MIKLDLQFIWLPYYILRHFQESAGPHAENGLKLNTFVAEFRSENTMEKVEQLRFYIVRLIGRRSLKDITDKAEWKEPC